MRILMISDVYFPRINGVSTSIQTFWREFENQGHELTLVAPQYPAVLKESNGIMRIPSRYLFFDPEDRMMRPCKTLGHLGRLRQRRFDIVHIQTPFVAHYAGVRLAEGLGLPRVESYHTFFEEYLYHYAPLIPKPWARFAARKFSKSQCNNVDAIIVPSTPMLEVLRGYGVSCPAAVIPTGIELERFREGDGRRFRARHQISAQRPVLLYIGRVAFEKNIDFLLRVLAAVRHEIPEALLIIAGEGPARGHLQRLTAKLGLQDNVLFVGYLSREDQLLDCYHTADVLVFASRTETQGLVLLEAMALGTPVVSTAVMGTRDILKPAKGAIIAEEATEDFAAKVVKVLQDKALRRRLSQEGQEYVKQWSAGALANKMLAFYGRIIAAHR